MSREKESGADEVLHHGEVCWQSPSNIAIIKYWGKKGFQIPANPSLSITLSKSFTETRIKYRPAKHPGNPQINFYFQGQPNQAFSEKIKTYFGHVKGELTFIDDLDFEIYSENTFPHSAGIASSASAMSALALCLCSIGSRLNALEESEDRNFFTSASHYARIGSGSAARSVFGKMASWGKSDFIPESADLIATPFTLPMHQIFENYQDSILLVSSGQKQVSSRAGHDLMKNNPFAAARYAQASTNMGKIIRSIQCGDIDQFIQIVESEALTLHGMMMASTPGYMLMEPGTVEVIKKIQAFREQSGVKLCFTLDAGPNVHVLYPEHEKSKVLDFIRDELEQHCVNKQWINDEMGAGPQRMI